MKNNTKSKSNTPPFDEKIIELENYFNNLKRWILVLPLQNPNIPYSEINSAIVQTEAVYQKLQRTLVSLYKNT
jgi:hypothetical protein